MICRFIFLVLFVSVLNAQDKVSSIFWEHHSQIKMNAQQEVIAYRIPYNILLFTKMQDSYESNFTLTVEVFDSTNFILREIKSTVVSTNDYSLTTSREEYFEDIIEFEISPGSYKIEFLLSIEGVASNIKIPSKDLLVSDIRLDSKPQIIIARKHNGNKYILANFSELTPFSPDTYYAIVAVSDTSIHQINYSVNQLDKQIVKDSVSSTLTGDITFEKNKNNIEVVITDSVDVFRIFFLRNYSELLTEGKAELIIAGKDSVEKYPLVVNWVNKPKILNNPEYSIKLISYIEEEETLKSLFSKGEENYYLSLFNYWDENYPTKETKFNYAMNEYYKRADYAIEHFSTLNSVDGGESDRGEIYISYGKPTSIERNYTEKNEIMEIWEYEKLGRTFMFKDITGTGKFILIK